VDVPLWRTSTANFVLSAVKASAGWRCCYGSAAIPGVRLADSGQASAPPHVQNKQQEESSHGSIKQDITTIPLVGF